MVNKSIFMDSRYSAKDVAIYVLWYCENKLNKAIDNLRLNKLLYLIQAKYLYLYNESIFLNLDERFEAWDYGPVMPKLWFEISKIFEFRIIKGFCPIDFNLFTKKEKEVIEEVLNITKNIDTWDLVKYLLDTYPVMWNYKIGDSSIPTQDIKFWVKENNGILIPKFLLEEKEVN
ncbi:Panacea domain-containing protein [Clostridioides difficile]|nr:Panacea domain-containing protein [Clostridioides difficile]MDK3168212.1 Panacea domain-containing protein [Clostridioides difficile]